MCPLAHKASRKRHRPKVPLGQRKRIFKACSECRLRKRRCIPASAGSCGYCSKHELDCKFETIEQSMERPKLHESPPHYDILARFNESYPEIDLKAHHVSFLFELFRGVTESPGQLSSETGGTFDDTTPPTSQRRDCLFESDPSNGKTGQRHAFVQGGDVLPHRRFLAAAAAAAALPESDKLDLQQDTHDLDPADEPFHDIDPDFYHRIAKDFPSREEAEILISSFFLYADTNWYYLDETWFRQQLSELYGSWPSIILHNPKFLCLALSVFSLGSLFVQLYQGRMDTPEIVAPSPGDIPGIRYFHYAQKLIPQVITPPSFEGLLSCLLLALSVLPIHSAETCYTYLGLALRIAICLGLHRKQPHSPLSTSDLEIRNRVFWTSYSIERRVAIALGFPEMLQIKDIDCPLPQRNPNLDALGSFRAERLLAYTRLTLLINQVAHLNVSDEASTDGIRRQLLSWEADLPAPVKVLEGDRLRLNVHLQLHYSMAWIYMGRAALIDRVRSKLRAKDPARANLGIKRGDQLLSDSCANHAKRIIDLIDVLRTRGKLGLFSYTDFHTCSSATIIILLDSILKPQLVTFPKVRMAMDALRYLATGSAVAKQCLKYVERFQDVVNKALASMCQKEDYDPCLLGEVESTQCRGECLPDEAERSENAYPQNYEQGPKVEVFNDLEAVLEDCVPTELHLLCLGGLFARNTFA